MTVSNWVSDDPITPGIGRMGSSTDANRALVRAPTKTHDVYLADQASAPRELPPSRLISLVDRRMPCPLARHVSVWT